MTYSPGTLIYRQDDGNDTSDYPDLEAEISSLQKMAAPLNKRVVVSPLMPVISRIMALDQSLQGAAPERVAFVEREVKECRRLLDAMSYHYVESIISHATPPKVFQILASANDFALLLKRSVGKTIKSKNPEGEEVELIITPQIVEFLTRFKFSLGTPPVSPEGIKVVEKLLFGGDLQSLYAFRDTLKGGPRDKIIFDRLISSVSRVVSDSTHYTTQSEAEKLENEATDYNGFEGLRGFSRTVISGGADNAERLIKEHLLAHHGYNGNSPVDFSQPADMFGKKLIDKMRDNKETLYVVRASTIPHNTFASDELHEKWEGIIGRLIIVDDSPAAKNSRNTFVYSYLPNITQELRTFHIKDSGTPASPQMNLRRIFENFKDENLDTLAASIDEQIAWLEKEGAINLPAEKIRKKAWLVTKQRQYLSLKKFKEFLTFLKQLKTSSEEERTAIDNRLVDEAETLTMQYFYGSLEAKDYKCAYVPEGGGRRALGHIANYRRDLLKTKLEVYKDGKLTTMRARLNALKAKRGVDPDSTIIADEALDRSMYERDGSPLHDISGNPPGISGHIKAKASAALQQGANALSEQLQGARIRVEDLTEKNITGEVAAKVAKRLGEHGIGGASKIGERRAGRGLAGALRGAQGLTHRVADAVLTAGESAIRRVQLLDENRDLDLDFAEAMLNDIANGSFHPSIAKAKIGWTVDDVFLKDHFPSKNYIDMEMKANGEPDPKTLERKLEDVHEKLRAFPELFELYCSSIVLYVNDPHNPTSKALRPQTKIALLQIASKYGLTMCSDEAYRKQIDKNLKAKQGDWSLAEFYEEHREYFARPITIHTVLATTKFYGAGKRTGSVVTNEASGGLVRHIKTHTNSVNTMSVKMDVQMLAMGIEVKSVCKKLEKIYLGADPDKTLDAILAEDFKGPLYFALVDARNNLDILKTRSVNIAEYRIEAVKFVDKLISDLKNFRLEKLSQKDSQNRNIAAKKAIESISKDYPEIKDKCIQPEGPFYMCIKLDETGGDQSLFPFLSALAEARNIDVVPQADGYVRFAFGGIMDSNPESYDLYSLAIETNLRLLLKYWAEFKERSASQREAGNLQPEVGALEEMFPGGEEELVRAYYDKEELLNAIGAYEKKHKKGSPLAYTHRSDVDEYISRIEPGSKSHVVTIKEVKCQTAQEFVESKTFRDLYNHYLLQIQSRISALQPLNQSDLFAKYGAVKIADKFKRKVYKDQERKVFAAIVTEMAKLWFSDSTIKILAKEGGDITQDDLMGTGQKLSGFIQELIKATLTKEQEKALITDINKRAKPEFEDVETKYKSTFQAGYSYMKGLSASAKNPSWLSKTITRGEYAKETVATDPSPTVTTGSSARVPGIDRQIFKRDGDGKRAPKSKYFSQRLARFAEVYDPEKFLMKMVHVGGTKVLVVMDRSYSHYISDEIRLFPQFEVTEEDLKDIKPDAVSFLGLPTNVMGEDYKLGYFMDKDADGNDVPVSWVDKEDITDYMGYFKKPILTVANEVVKNKEMLPIHGSAMTICLKNGLRKTVVMGGDSGTGKSETIIAMMEDIVRNSDSPVESIELLAGDMLSLFEGDDGQMYMLGTEQGDFMRMTDISEGWQERFRNLLETGARTNLNDPNNPRITVSGICDANKIAVPTRVNMFLNINNYDEPPGGISFHETDDPENLMLQDYVRGYRGEKGTSGDQPNLFASIGATKNIPNQKKLLKYGEKMDSVVGWDDIVDDSGKAVNAIMRFKNVEGGIFKAKQIVKDMFVGKKVGDATITETPFNVQTGQFEAVFKFADGHTEKTLLDREGVFSKIYNPIASTFGGDPFVDPRNVSKKLLRRFGKVMKNAGVITGTLYTQLKRQGMEFEGPIGAAKAVTGFIMGDTRINDRFQGQKKKVNQALQDRYGSAIIDRGGTGSIPVDIERRNLYLNEIFESRTIRPKDSNGNVIPLKTKRYEYDPSAKAKGFECSLITPEIQRAIEVVCSESEHDIRPYDMRGVKLWAYKDIKAWNSKEELIYQIMICNGSMMLGYDESVIRQHVVEVKKAEKIAERLMAANISNSAFTLSPTGTKNGFEISTN